jgi:putative ABC transport system permease protein
VTGKNFSFWREQSSKFADMAAARYRTLTLSGEGEAERVVGIGATWNYFQVLGVAPILGRTYQADEDRPGAAAPVAVVSHSLWTRRFGGDPDAVGEELVVNGRPHRVVGVLPRGFRYPYSAEIWVPLALGPESEEWSRGNLNISGRLAPGSSMDAAREEMEAIALRLAQERPETNRGIGVALIRIEEEVLEGMDAKVKALLGAALFVLLIACANVATIVMARLQRAHGEMAVRLALGAGRREMARPILAEGLFLGLSAGILGVLLAVWAGPPLSAMSPVDDLGPFFQSIGVDGVVVAFGLVAGLGVAVLFSLPALLHAGDPGVGSLLRGARGVVGGRRERKALDGLVVAEVAIAVVLLTGAGLMLKTLQNLQDRDLGIDPRGLVSFGIAPSIGGYEALPDRLAFLDGVLERIRALPEVEGAAFTNFNPLRDQGWGATLWPEDAPSLSEEEAVTVNHRGVSHGYFEVAGTDLVAGREFTRADDGDAPGVVILSESLAQRLWPGERALGRRVRVGLPSAGGRVLTVVGVAEDVADFGVLTDTWYVPYRQDPREFTTRTLELFVRALGEASGVIAEVRTVIREMDPALPVFRIETGEEIVRFERRGETFTTFLLSLFATLGLLLAAVGIYGVLSHAVTRRRRELSVRVALGAGTGEILGLVLGGSYLVVGLGLLFGLVAAGVLTRFISSFLVGVSPLDPGVFGVISAGTLVVAAVAGGLPAWRATRVDPRKALQEE